MSPPLTAMPKDGRELPEALSEKAMGRMPMRVMIPISLKIL